MLFYQGRRDKDGRCGVWICTRQGVHGELPVRLDIANHSPDGFEWGYRGSGPRQLAVALIAHATGSSEWALAYSNFFKEAIVAKLPHDAWELTKDEVIQTVRTLHEKFLREIPDLQGILDADAIRERNAPAETDPGDETE